jgi:PAS domain S-box-containing protein
VPAALRAHLNELVEEARRLSQAPDAPSREEILYRLIDPLPLAAFVANNEGQYVVTNRVASRLTQYSPEELQGMSVWDLTRPQTAHDADVLWRAFLQQREQTGEYELLRRDGTVASMLYAARAHVLPGLHLSLLTPERIK